MDVYDKIRKFNAVFGLPAPTSIPVSLDRNELARRIDDEFMRMLLKEFSEGGIVMRKLRDPEVPLTEALVELADWLADIQVYCASEMVRHGIPIEPVMHAVMDSQESKLVNGRPLVENGKVMKGPFFVGPEAQIGEIIDGVLR